MDASYKHPVVAVVGPTATGKTALGVALAEQFGGEVISADSMQIYKEVAIGTAKASREEQAEVKHYLVDAHSVFEDFSVKNFVDEARSAIGEIAGKDKLPITGLIPGMAVHFLIGDEFGHAVADGVAAVAGQLHFLAAGGMQHAVAPALERALERACKCRVIFNQQQ